MATIRLYVAKFGREVLIDKDHPLALAQVALSDAPTAPAAQDRTADPPSGNAPSEDVASAATVPLPAASGTAKRARRRAS